MFDDRKKWTSLCGDFCGRTKTDLTLQRFLRTHKTAAHSAAVFADAQNRSSLCSGICGRTKPQLTLQRNLVTAKTVFRGRGRPKARLTLKRFSRTPKTTSHAAAVYVGTPAKRLQSEPPFRQGEPLCSVYVGTRVLCRVLRTPGGPRKYVFYVLLDGPGST